MKVLIKIVSLSFLFVGSSLSAIPVEGKLGQVSRDGSIVYGIKPYDYGFPAFKSWPLSADEIESQVLLEGTIISTNSGTKMQGVRVYVQYGDEKRILLAISDADGKVKMKMDRKQTHSGVSKKLMRLIIGDVDKPGSFVRAFMASKPQPPAAEQDITPDR